jgi:integrase/recombinase XerC
VLTVLPWTVEVLTAWVEEVLPAFGSQGPALWPTERADRLTQSPISHRFKAYRNGRCQAV